MRILKIINHTFLFLFFYICCISCSSDHYSIVYYENMKNNDTQNISEGVLCTEAQRIKYLRNGKLGAVIEVSSPVLVAQADQEEKWGFFQFPKIGVTDDGTLIVNWQMKDDSAREFGKASKREYTPMYSKDYGKTWYPQTNRLFGYIKEYNTKT